MRTDAAHLGAGTVGITITGHVDFDLENFGQPPTTLEEISLGLIGPSDIPERGILRQEVFYLDTSWPEY